MKTEMYKFLLEKSLAKVGKKLPDYMQFAIAFKYPHYGAPKPLPLMDRPHGPGYTTNPHLSRPGFAPGMAAILSHPVGAVIAIGIAVPLFSDMMARKFPHNAVPEHAPKHFNNPTQLYLQN